MSVITPQREYTVRQWRHYCGFVITLAGTRLDRPEFCPYCKEKSTHSERDFEELIES